MHQTLFRMVRKYKLDFCPLARNPFLSLPLKIRKTRGSRGGIRALPLFFESLPLCKYISHLERKESASGAHLAFGKINQMEFIYKM